MDTLKTREIVRKVRQIELRANRLVDDTMGSHYRAVFKGRGLDCAEVREYVRGDAARSIDWNVTARTGRPHVKTFREERERTLVLMIDISASSHFGSSMQAKRELAAELGSVLALSANRNHDRFGLILFTDRVELFLPPDRGRRHLRRVIREILFFRPRSAGGDASKALDFLNRVFRRRALAFFISDFCLPGPMEELRRKLQTTNRRHDLLAVSVNDPREFEMPDVGIITLKDSETGAEARIDTSDPNLRKAFAEEAARRWDVMKRRLRACGIEHLELDTGMPYLPCLMNFLDSRKARRAS